MKVAIYVRVSTSTENQINSFENQQRYFINEVKKHEDWEIYNTYADEGLTGTKLDRPQFVKMLEDAGLDVKIHKYKNQIKYNYFDSHREPKFKYILVKNTSRFARNLLSIDVIRELRRKKVYVYFNNLKKSTENLADDFVITLFQLLDEQEVKEKSERIKFGHRQSAESGIINVSKRIYGFEFVKGEKSEDNKLIAITHEAEVIKMIFNLYADGYGVRRILNALNEKGIRTRKGKEFSKSTISKMLQNEKYAGILVRNKYETGTVLMDKHYPKLKQESKWIYHSDANIETIISEELFSKCQEIRKGKINYKQQKGKYTGLSEFAQTIVCGKCGAYYTRNIDKGRVFYNCGTKKTKGIKVCDNINISERRLEKTIDDFLNGDIETRRDYNLMIFAYVKGLESIKQDIITTKLDKDKQLKVDILKTKLKELKSKDERLLDLYLDKVIVESIYIIKKGELDILISEVEEEIHELSKDNSVYEKEIDDLEKLINNLEYFDIDSIDSHEKFMNELAYITIAHTPYEENHIQVDFYFNDIYKYIKKYGMLTYESFEPRTEDKYEPKSLFKKLP